MLHLHVVRIGNLAVLITNDWESQFTARDLIDVLDPTSVRLNGVGRETDQLDATLGELRLELCESTQLSCADGSIILGVREQDNPLIANEFMEVDGTVGGLRLEVWCNGSQAEATNGKC